MWKSVEINELKDKDIIKEREFYIVGDKSELQKITYDNKIVMYNSLKTAIEIYKLKEEEKIHKICKELCSKIKEENSDKLLEYNNKFDEEACEMYLYNEIRNKAEYMFNNTCKYIYYIEAYIDELDLEKCRAYSDGRTTCIVAEEASNGSLSNVLEYCGEVNEANIAVRACYVEYIDNIKGEK